MSRVDCISNRNLRIIAAYVTSKLGHCDGLFDGVPYPTERFPSAEEFFLDEDEWTTHPNFLQIFRRGKEMTGEPYFFFHCGASAAPLRSWGRMDHFVRIFTGPSEGFRRLPFFNKNFADTKDLDVVLPPAFSKDSRKIRTVLRIRHHPDIDVHEDFVGDPFSRGILSIIPCLWGLRSATVRQTLNPYDPEILLNREPEFAPYRLEARVEGERLTIRSPSGSSRRVVGRRVILLPEQMNGQRVFLGRYEEPKGPSPGLPPDAAEGVLVTETVRDGSRILLKAGEIFKAPYFILEVTYDRFSFRNRIRQIFRPQKGKQESEKGLVESLNQLRETVEARNKAYTDLEKVNVELLESKRRVDEYARTLEQKVEERTAELRRAREELLHFNRNLELKVNTQVEEIRKYQELRRYVSLRIADKILSAGGALGNEPQRKMMTVLFSDIRSFSSFSETLEPEELFKLLQHYLSEMTRIIHQHEGTLNKIIGDGMLVFFGDPIPMEDHAERAVQTAIAMQTKVAELKADWLHYGQELGIGIGINTGYMSVGSIGSELHKDYTVIGNQVNVASRLESMAKAGEILISHRTYAKVKHTAGAERVGHFQVKGIYYPIITYRVRIPPSVHDSRERRSLPDSKVV